jgi:hypothetical protein
VSYYVRRIHADGRNGFIGSIRSERQANKEANAWRSAGWSAEVLPNSPALRRVIRDWENKKANR